MQIKLSQCYISTTQLGVVNWYSGLFKSDSQLLNCRCADGKLFFNSKNTFNSSLIH
jgi:hypothetical protein